MTSSRFISRGMILRLSCAVGLLFALSCTKKPAQISDADGATFYVDTVTATFSADSLNSNQVVNRKFINFTACLKDNAQQAAIMHIAFQVKAGTVAVSKQTDERGCIIWQELFEFDPFDNEKQIQMTRTITATQDHSGHEDVQLAYNPWNSDNLVFMKREAAQGAEALPITYTAGSVIKRTDTSTQQQFLTPVDIHGVLESQTLKKTDVTALSLTFLERDYANYEVSPLLMPSIAHKYRIKFVASMIRNTLTSGTTLQALNAGKFKFYFVLLDEDYKTKGFDGHIVSANTFESDAELGRFIADVSLKFDNVAALASRMTGVLTLLSEDEPKGFAEMSFTGPVSPVAGGSGQGIDLEPTSDLSAHTLYDRAIAYKATQNKTKALDLFKSNPLHSAMDSSKVNVTIPFDLKQCMFDISGACFMVAKDKAVTYDLFAQFQKQRQGFVMAADEKATYSQALCMKYFTFANYAANPTLKAAFDACHEHPEDMVTGVIREFVDDVIDPVPASYGIPEEGSITMANQLSFTNAASSENGDKLTSGRDWSWSLGGSVDGNAGVGAKTPEGPATAGISVGVSGSAGGKFYASHDWYEATSASRNVTTTTTETETNNSTNISSEAFTFTVHVKAHTCFLVSPTQKMKDMMAKTSYPEVRYFCGTDSTPVYRNETYYFLNENTTAAASPLSDGMSAQDNPFRIFIRGTQTYNFFGKLFSNPNLKIAMQKVPEEKDVFNQFKDFYITQEFPGMLSPVDPNSVPTPPAK